MAERDVPLSAIGAFVPFPTALFDEQMPKLKDTEWRLLCVIVRQTLGWQSGSGKGRKRRDWMSQKQLMARTGRASAALSAALDVLVRENLVECRDAQDELLLSPQQRRQHRGRVYFSLSPRLLQANLPQKKQTAALRSQPSQRASRADNRKPEECDINRTYTGWANAGAIAVKRYADRGSIL